MIGGRSFIGIVIATADPRHRLPTPPTHQHTGELCKAEWAPFWSYWTGWLNLLGYLSGVAAFAFIFADVRTHAPTHTDPTLPRKPPRTPPTKNNHRHLHPPNPRIHTDIQRRGEPRGRRAGADAAGDGGRCGRGAGGVGAPEPAPGGPPGVAAGTCVECGTCGMCAWSHEWHGPTATVTNPHRHHMQNRTSGRCGRWPRPSPSWWRSSRTRPRSTATARGTSSSTSTTTRASPTGA